MLDPLEEGLLLLVQAGVQSIPEAALLLGCSERYAREMSTRLAGARSSYSCLQLFGDDGLLASPRTDSVLETRHRQIPSQKNSFLLRDAVFGDWLSYGDVTFDLTPMPNPEDGPYRWLGPVVSSVSQDPDAAEYALACLSEREIAASELGQIGDLQWITLWLGCYQPYSGARGRYLLFNPACEDAPMLDLTLVFEQDLGRQPVRLYFLDGPLRTSELFWQSLAERIKCERKVDELESNKAYLAEVTKHEQRLRRTTAISATETSHSPTASETTTASTELATPEETPIDEELLAAQRAVSAAQVKVAELECQLANAPRIEHLEAGQHPAVLREVIRQSYTLLILICPWIRIRVLRPLLPEIDAAIRRGVQILIGYGMPKSSHHPDKTDEEALDELRQRQSEQQLWLVHLGTHEKVMIQDDQVFVNTSFNFFSYTGGDSRRESGTLQRGGASHDVARWSCLITGSQLLCLTKLPDQLADRFGVVRNRSQASHFTIRLRNRYSNRLGMDIQTQKS
jgi:hypothetical protein